MKYHVRENITYSVIEATADGRIDYSARIIEKDLGKNEATNLALRLSEAFDRGLAVKEMPTKD